MKLGLRKIILFLKTLSTNGNHILQYFEPYKQPIDAVSSVKYIQCVEKRYTTETFLK